MQDAFHENMIEVVGGAYPFFRHVTGMRDGLDLRYKDVGPGPAFTAVLENLPFQVNEFSLANYTMMRERGVQWMSAIPVFLNRAFRHASLYVRRDSDLTHPSQLRGKTIGAKEYSQSAGVWWRGTMIDEYDLHWSEVKWFAGPVQRFVPPAQAAVRTIAGDMEQMVIDGSIDAFSRSLRTKFLSIISIMTDGEGGRPGEWDEYQDAWSTAHHVHGRTVAVRVENDVANAEVGSPGRIRLLRTGPDDSPLTLKFALASGAHAATLGSDFRFVGPKKRGSGGGESGWKRRSNLRRDRVR